MLCCVRKYKSPPPPPNKCTCIWEYILRVKQCNKNYQYSTDLAVSFTIHYLVYTVLKSLR